MGQHVKTINLAKGFRRMRLAGIAGLLAGFLMIAFGWAVNASSLPIPLGFHPSLGILLIFFGVPLCVLGWIGEGFTSKR